MFITNIYSVIYYTYGSIFLRQYGITVTTTAATVAAAAAVATTTTTTTTTTAAAAAAVLATNLYRD